MKTAFYLPQMQRNIPKRKYDEVGNFYQTF